MFDLSVYYMYLQYFDTVGWVFWPVKTVSHILCWRGRKTLHNPIQSVRWQPLIRQLLNGTQITTVFSCLYRYEVQEAGQSVLQCWRSAQVVSLLETRVIIDEAFDEW